MQQEDIVARASRGRVPVDTPLGRARRVRPPDLSLLSISPPRRNRNYLEFLSAAECFIETPPSRFRTASGYIMCGALVVFICWSLFSYLPMFAIAPGEVVSRIGNQVVETRVGGSVASILVKDGDVVTRGATVLRLNDTVAVSDREIIRNKIADLKAETVRRHAAIVAVQKDPVALNDTVSWDADVAAPVRAREDSVLRSDLSAVAATIADLTAQRAAKSTSRDRLSANITAEESLIEARTERTKMSQQLADKGWDSRAKVLEALEPLRQEQVALATLKGSLAEAEAAIPVIDHEIADVRQAFITSNTQANAAAARQLDTLRQQLVQADKAVDDMNLIAPIDGVIHALAVTTVGQSVRPGQQLLQIIPQGTPIDITAYVLNTDIGFVKAGQPVTIKVDSFPYTRYGTISGRVIQVGADAIPGRMALLQQGNDATPQTSGSLSVTSAVQETSDLVFPVVIRPDRDWIDVAGRKTTLLAGMSLAVEIETERQRTIAYVLYPLTRAFQH